MNFRGASGDVSFNAQGDRVNYTITMYSGKDRHTENEVSPDEIWFTLTECKRKLLKMWCVGGVRGYSRQGFPPGKLLYIAASSLSSKLAGWEGG